MALIPRISHSRPHVVEDDLVAVIDCLRSGMIGEGDAAADLEADFTKRYEGTDAVATSSGTQALVMALQALSVTVGDEIVVPTYVCPEVMGAVEACGASVRIADVGDDYLLSRNAVAQVASPRLKAIVLPYVLGIGGASDGLTEFNVPIIEDCAQRMTTDAEPTAAVLSVYSFGATKVITGGEGGLVLARDGELAARLRSLKRLKGTSYRLNLRPMPDIVATLVRSQFRRLKDTISRRLEIAETYLSMLAGVPMLHLPRHLLGRSMFYRFPVLVGARGRVHADAFIAGCARRGVTVRRPVADLLHHIRPSAGRMPVAQALYNQTVSLPLYPSLSEDDIQCVVEAARTTAEEIAGFS